MPHQSSVNIYNLSCCQFVQTTLTKVKFYQHTSAQIRTTCQRWLKVFCPMQQGCLWQMLLAGLNYHTGQSWTAAQRQRCLNKKEKYAWMYKFRVLTRVSRLGSTGAILKCSKLALSFRNLNDLLFKKYLPNQTLSTLSSLFLNIFGLIIVTQRVEL